MKHTLTIFLSLLLALILLSDRLPAQGKRCSFVTVKGTLNKTVEQSQYQFRAIRIGAAQIEGRRTTVFEVTEIIRNPNDNGIRVGRTMKIWEPAVPAVTGDLVRDTKLADGHQPGSTVMMVSDRVSRRCKYTLRS